MIPLSPIDHVFTGAGAYPLEFVFAYAQPIDAGRLAESLRGALALFPAVSSRLARQAGLWALEPTPSGCTFETATSPIAFADAHSRAAFVSPVETLEGEPLARIRLTRTPDGSVLGVSLSHAVVDGFSYFYFLSAWSLVFRGEAVPPPCDERSQLAAPSVPGASGCDADAVLAGAGLFLDTPRRQVPRDRLSWSRRLFPRDELRALHAEAQAECPVRLSHNDVLAAGLWREHVPRWTRPSEPLAFLSCPVDVRRVLPGFPGNYFGCAVALASAALPLEQLRETPLPQLARRVRDAVAAVDEARMTRALVTLAALGRDQGLAGFERLHVVHPRAGLLVTNLSRLPVREIVFDAGPPVAFDILAPAERCAVVLPAADGLDVRVCAPLPA